MPKKNLVNRKNLHSILLTWQTLSAVWRSQIIASYSIFGRTNEQYKTFRYEIRLRSFDNLIIILKALAIDANSYLLILSVYHYCLFSAAFRHFVPRCKKKSAPLRGLHTRNRSSLTFKMLRKKRMSTFFKNIVE
jgi:hypothetical protein